MVGVVFWEIAYNFIKEKPLVGKEKERKKPTSKILLLCKVFKRLAKVNGKGFYKFYNFAKVVDQSKTTI